MLRDNPLYRRERYQQWYEMGYPFLTIGCAGAVVLHGSRLCASPTIDPWMVLALGGAMHAALVSSAAVMRTKCRRMWDDLRLTRLSPKEIVTAIGVPALEVAAAQLSCAVLCLAILPASHSVKTHVFSGLVHAGSGQVMVWRCILATVGAAGALASGALAGIALAAGTDHRPTAMVVGAATTTALQCMVATMAHHTAGALILPLAATGRVFAAQVSVSPPVGLVYAILVAFETLLLCSLGWVSTRMVSRVR